jgi:6-phosphogluconolactonase (cycloisomerase 2 family)
MGRPRASDLVGHVYMQTNETQNRIMHFGRNEDGQLELRESIPTGGAGSGVFKPISGQESAPNAFEGAGSVILAESNTLLFTTNGGDNSVTSFRVNPDGNLTMIDRQSTGEPVTGRTGTAKSLVYRPQSRTLYVLHAFGPNHLRSYTVAASDSWLTPDDQYFHQIFGNASVLVSYRLDKTSGRLTEIGRNPIPYNSPQGLAGF